MTFIPRSAWIGHEEFMDWLVSTRRPSVFVELGVHSGWSFFAACNAAKRIGHKMRSIGIDTFKGDEHTGAYDEDVFEGVTAIQQAHFPNAELWRMTFDEAAEKVAPTSVDLLHIDGRHLYEDVKHDFETWEPKLFPGATVLFHDIEVPEFGVRQFWDEIKRRYPHFEFDHAYGLGVLTYR